MDTSSGPGPWSAIRQWLFEIVCLFGSVAFLLVMVAVLSVYNNKPLPTLPASISLNSVVAVITVLAKGCFTAPLVECLSQWKWNWFHHPRSVDQFDAFDQASRGLWGSAILVWKLRFRHAVTFGALLYVVSVIVSLFTQESISYEPGVTRTGGPRSASVRRVYHWGLDDLQRKSGSLAIDAALMTSLFDDRDKTAVDLVPTCSSANCTYPDITTLSVCSQVVEITSSVTTRKVVNATDYPWALLSDDQGLLLGNTPVLGSSDKILNEIRNTTDGIQVSLPNGLSFGIPDMDTIYITSMNDSVSFPTDDDRYRVGLASMVAFFNSVVRGEDPQLVAFEVFFHMCVNTYNVTVSNSKARSTIISSYYTAVPGGSGTNRPLGCGTNTTCNDARNGTRDSHIAFRTESVQYSLDTTSAEYIGTSIARYLTGWRATNSAGETIIHGHSAYKLMNDFSMDPSYMPGPALKLIVQRAAAGLNQVLQNTRWGNSVLIWGTAWESTVFVRVQWGWLGLLAGEIGLAILFFGYTVHSTHQMGVRPLKSSSMATLLALDPQSRMAVEDVVAETKEKKKRKEKAEREWIKVQLSDRRLVLTGGEHSHVQTDDS